MQLINLELFATAKNKQRWRRIPIMVLRFMMCGNNTYNSSVGYYDDPRWLEWKTGWTGLARAGVLPQHLARRVWDIPAHGATEYCGDDKLLHYPVTPPIGLGRGILRRYNAIGN